MTVSEDEVPDRTPPEGPPPLWMRPLLWIATILLSPFVLVDPCGPAGAGCISYREIAMALAGCCVWIVIIAGLAAVIP